MKKLLIILMLSFFMQSLAFGAQKYYCPNLQHGSYDKNMWQLTGGNVEKGHAYQFVMALKEANYVRGVSDSKVQCQYTQNVYLLSSKKYHNVAYFNWKYVLGSHFYPWMYCKYSLTYCFFTV